MATSSTNGTAFLAAKSLVARGFPTALKILTETFHNPDEHESVGITHRFARRLLEIKGDFTAAVAELSKAEVQRQLDERRIIVEQRKATVEAAKFLIKYSRSLTEATQCLINTSGQLPPSMGGLRPVTDDGARCTEYNFKENEETIASATALLAFAGGVPAAVNALLKAQEDAEEQQEQQGQGSSFKKWVYLAFRIVRHLAIIYYLFISMIVFAFYQRYPGKFLMIIDVITAIFFFIDFILQLVFIIESSDNYYRKAWRFILIILDVLGSLPWDWFAVKSVLRWFITVRLIRVRRTITMLLNHQKRGGLLGNLLKFFEIVFIFMFLAHNACCLFYYLPMTLPQSERANTWFKKANESYPDFEKRGLTTRYTASLSFSVTSLTTVGYGDIHPVNNRERFFGIIYLIIGIFVTFYMSYRFSKIKFREIFEAGRHQILNVGANNPPQIPNVQANDPPQIPNVQANDPPQPPQV